MGTEEECGSRTGTLIKNNLFFFFFTIYIRQNIPRATQEVHSSEIIYVLQPHFSIITEAGQSLLSNCMKTVLFFVFSFLF